MVLVRPPDTLIDRTGVFHEWEEVGWFYIDRLIKRCNLGPKSNLLDIGCGPGRMELMCREKWGQERTGQYYGMEVDKDQTDWMITGIPGANIVHANVLNKRYNANGTIDPVTYKFPFPSSSADVAVLLSVFTHMMEPETRNYAQEIHRMLKPGGRALITCFIRDDSGNEGMKLWSKETFEDMMKPMKVVEFLPGDWAGGLQKHYVQDCYILEK